MAETDVNGLFSTSSDDGGAGGTETATEIEETSSVEGEQESSPDGGTSEPTLGTDTTPKTEEKSGPTVEELLARQKELENQAAAAERRAREMQSRLDREKHERGLQRDERIKSLQKRFDDDAQFESYATEHGPRAATVEWQRLGNEIASLQSETANEQAAAQRSQQEADNRAYGQMFNRYAEITGDKNTDKFWQFIDARQGYRGWTIETAMKDMEAVLMHERGQSVSITAQENMARKAEADARRKIANQTPRSGTSPAPPGQTAPANILERMQAAKARMDSGSNLSTVLGR